MSNTSMPQLSQYYHILSDGTVCASRWKNEIGDRYQKPGTPQFLPIKFTLTNEEYTIVKANTKTIIDAFNKRKAEILRAHDPWHSVSKAATAKEMYDKFVGTGEPLMRESVFVSMIHFI